MENRRPIAEQKDVEIQIEQSAHALPQTPRIIHHLFAQQPALSRRIADHASPTIGSLRSGQCNATSPTDFPGTATIVNGPTVSPTVSGPSISAPWPYRRAALHVR